MFALISSACDKWTVLPRPGLHRDVNRFGHSAVVSNGWAFPPPPPPLYISCVWQISAGSLSVFTALVSSCKESIQLLNSIQLIHFEWIIHSPFFFLTFPWCLAVSSKFWNSQPVSGFSRRRCYPDSVCLSLFFNLNVKFSVLCLLSFLPLLTSLML